MSKVTEPLLVSPQNGPEERAQIKELSRVVKLLPSGRRNFANSLISQSTTLKLSPNQMFWVQRLINIAVLGDVQITDVTLWKLLSWLSADGKPGGFSWVFHLDVGVVEVYCKNVTGFIVSDEKKLVIIRDVHAPKGAEFGYCTPNGDFYKAFDCPDSVLELVDRLSQDFKETTKDYRNYTGHCPTCDSPVSKCSCPWFE